MIAWVFGGVAGGGTPRLGAPWRWNGGSNHMPSPSALYKRGGSCYNGYMITSMAVGIVSAELSRMIKGGGYIPPPPRPEPKKRSNFEDYWPFILMFLIGGL